MPSKAEKYDRLDLEITLFCAFRYALGRYTYVPRSVSKAILENWDIFSNEKKPVFAVEVMSWRRIIDRYEKEKISA